ncbi:MAG: hypothetical protein ACOYT8_05720 [Candidatus Dependentiae bacterium]
MTKHIKEQKWNNSEEKKTVKPEHKQMHPGYQGVQKKSAKIEESKENVEHKSSGNHLDEDYE